ncbi:toxin [Dehalococcoidia bacterium]|nr:toxin [Dehalococcoidia bacterium]
MKKERGISLEQIIFHLSQGDLWKTADHPDQEKYPGQKIYFVLMDDYIYLVPYKREGDQIFLKTIIPGRKATRHYKKELEE